MKAPKFGTEEFRAKYWLNVDKSSEKWACWLWRRSRYKSKSPRHAYGHCWRDGEYDKAHRVVWEMEHFPIPEGFVVIHLCDNGWCVNPDHLVVGTQAANMYDAWRKGHLQKDGPRAQSIPPAQQPLIMRDSVDR